MFKQTLLATVAVFVLWSVIDFIVHGVLLHSAYQETMHLWRPEDQMHALLMSAVTLFFSLTLMFTYAHYVVPKSLATGLGFGAVLGIGVGTLTGLGSFAYMPIPLYLAAAWYLVNFVKIAL
ncbi:MAG: hypothetical protein ACPIB1_10150, partial [Porticoccaceae bacterium]